MLATLLRRERRAGNGSKLLAAFNLSTEEVIKDSGSPLLSLRALMTSDLDNLRLDAVLDATTFQGTPLVSQLREQAGLAGKEFRFVPVTRAEIAVDQLAPQYWWKIGDAEYTDAAKTPATGATSTPGQLLVQWVSPGRATAIELWCNSEGKGALLARTRVGALTRTAMKDQALLGKLAGAQVRMDKKTPVILCFDLSDKMNYYVAADDASLPIRLAPPARKLSNGSVRVTGGGASYRADFEFGVMLLWKGGQVTSDGRGIVGGTCHVFKDDNQLHF
jgi:hypothetical protein